MITLAINFAALALFLLINRLLYRQWVNWRRLVWLSVISLIVGLCLDYIVGYRWELWYYTHHPYWTATYYWHLIPAWLWALPCFAVMYDTAAFTFKHMFVRVAVYFAGVPGLAEASGYMRDAWRYDSPAWLMAIGWTLLLGLCIGVWKGLAMLETVTFTIEWFNQPVLEVIK